ncbi:hypothetical protein V7I42_00205 [Raoultella ornithinolytica]|uniref:hypothetical protein n=1 Tax=Raoultella ornithinolytica TaxID=54291 RepID=UPI002FF28856
MAGLTKEERAARAAAALIEEQEIAFVMMKRDPDKYDAPHTAQVHPDEVVNYYSGGWVVDKD